MTRQYKPDYLEKAVYASLRAMTTTPIVFAGQQHHELRPPYVTLSVDSRRTQGTDELFAVMDDGTQVYHGQRNGGITLIFVGDESTADADALVNTLNRPDAARLARLNGPVLFGAKPINIGPIQTEGCQAEQACVVDLQYRIAVAHMEKGELIYYVAVNYEIYDAGNKRINRDALVTALQGEVLDPAVVYAVAIVEPHHNELKVGHTIPERIRWLPVPVMPLRVDLSYDPAMMQVDTVNGASTWTFLQAGDLRVTFTLVNKNQLIVSDTIVLQISA